MAILSKGCIPDNFKSHISLKLSFANIRGLYLNFVASEHFLELNFPDIVALCETNLDDSIDSGNYLWRLSSFNPKGFYYSYAWSCEGKTSFCTGLTSKKLCGTQIMFLTGFTSLSILRLFPWLITFFFIQDFWFYFILHSCGSPDQFICWCACFWKL